MTEVKLGAHFEDFVTRQIETGRYQDVSDVVRAALQLLEDHERARADRAAELARDINVAFDEDGDDVSAQEALDEIERRYRADMSARIHGA